jgi:hypothetical protein
MSDGQDITTTFTTNYPDYVEEFKDGGDLEISYTAPGGSTATWTDHWEFTKDKTGLNITEAGVTTLSTILMLKHAEIWFKKTVTNSYTTNIIETHLIPN